MLFKLLNIIFGFTDWLTDVWYYYINPSSEWPGSNTAQRTCVRSARDNEYNFLRTVTTYVFKNYK